MEPPSELLRAYKLRTRRRWLLWRALRKRRQLTVHADRTHQIKPGMILGFATIRNEAQRLPYWLNHHRARGVDHFLIVDNASTDMGPTFLRDQPDVSLWRSEASYKASRFGMDWLTWLMIRFGHNHWCLTLDADECLIYPHDRTRDLHALTGWLDQIGQPSMGAMMLDLYPRGPLSKALYRPGEDPTQTLTHFDARNYVMEVQPKYRNLYIQGGPRLRRFFAPEPQRGPTMSKVPLVKWNRRFVYANSTHVVLPRRLNHVYETDGGEKISGVLLHTKFLNTVVTRSAEERHRKEHFANSDLYTDYYQALEADPSLWCPASTRFTGWRQLEKLGLMSRGGWL